jgi:hypothetical protein
MPTVLLIIGAAAVLAGIIIAFGGFIVIADGVEDGNRRWVLGGIAALFLLAPAVGLGGFKVHVTGNRGLTERSCESFGRQTNYVTTVIVTAWYDKGECYVDYAGSWVPKDRLWAEMSGELGP